MPTFNLQPARAEKKVVTFEASGEKPHVFTPPDTVRGTFRGKLIRHLHESTVKELIRQAMEGAAVILLAWVLIDPRGGFTAFLSLFQAWGWALPKVAGAFIVVKYRNRILQAARRTLRHATRESDGTNNLVFGIPAVELTDFLIRNRHFKREGINGARATFGLNMDTFNRLSGELESTGVLQRGENNCRVLAPKWTRQALLDFFGQQSSRTFSDWFRIRRVSDSQDNAKVRFDMRDIEENATREEDREK